MNFSESELAILRNFAKINPTQIIKPDHFGAKDPSNSIIGHYKFETAYDFEPFGLYEVPMFLQALETFDHPDIEVLNDRLVISEGNSKITYFTSPLDLIKSSEAPDLSKKFSKLDCELDFDLSADKLATIHKTASIFKAQYLFLESDDDAIRLTVSSDSPGTSANSFDVVIRDNIRANNLDDVILKIPFTEMRVLPGDYTVQASAKKISKWSCFNNVDYYIGCAID